MDERKVVLYALASQERLSRSVGLSGGALQSQVLQGHVMVSKNVARTDFYDFSLSEEPI